MSTEEATGPDGGLGPVLSEIIAHRPVSIVGNAASLLERRHGAEIDGGCVVRLNSGIPVRPASQGRRTDIHCFSTRRSLDENLAKAIWRVRWNRRKFDGVFSVWMSAEDRETCADPRQAFYPLPLLEDLARQLGAKPSIGIRALYMFAKLTRADLRAFGFDFKKSPSFYRTKENRGPHDWDAERDLALSLVEQGRLTIVD